MKNFGTAPYANMKMNRDQELIDLLKDSIIKYGIDYAIETGTYLGDGSTKFISECFVATKAPKEFVTFEANYDNFCKAKENLKQFPFVTPIHGATISKEDAEEFLKNDEMLSNQDKYEDVYIDGDNVKPLDYLGEVVGMCADPEHSVAPAIDFKKYLRKAKKQMTLITLDSAGGVGYWEFQTMMDVLKNNNYLLLLDDIEHVKHHRSIEYIINHPEEFILLGKKDGWALAYHK